MGVKESPAMSETMKTEYVQIPGHNGDSIQAYAVTTEEPQAHGGLVMIHHNPGFDRGSREIARRFATIGYDVVMPNLYWRVAPGASAEDAAAASRASGGNSDQQVVGDVNGAAAYLRSLPSNNGRIGVVGYCSGGRYSVLCAMRGNFDAAIDCYGGSVTGKPRPDRDVTILTDQLSDLKIPLLGLFGNEDHNPTAEAVNEFEEILKAQGNTYEFYRYDEAGHGFFNLDRGGYRAFAFNDAWERKEEFLTKYLDG
jgi:carboxymethylenebutenolidase